MKHYFGTWTHDLPNEPDWMAYEVDEAKAVTRMVEHFTLGWSDYREASREDCESLTDLPFEPSEFDLDETMTLREITAEDFETIWGQRDASPSESE